MNWPAAASHQLLHAQFLELVFQDELNARAQRLIDKRTLEDFDWRFNPAIKRAQVYQQTRQTQLAGGLGKGLGSSPAHPQPERIRPFHPRSKPQPKGNP